MTARSKRHRMKDGGGTIGKIFGMEKNVTTYNLARMNMLLHGVKDMEFEIYHGDTLTNDWDMLREMNPRKKPHLAHDDDPRRNPFDWEVWHECDVFRAEVERRLREHRPR